MEVESEIKGEEENKREEAVSLKRISDGKKSVEKSLPKRRKRTIKRNLNVEI